MYQILLYFYLEVAGLMLKFSPFFSSYVLIVYVLIYILILLIILFLICIFSPSV